MMRIKARLDEFRALENGWLDGRHGLAPSQEGLDWLALCFERRYPDELPIPYLYPTAEGGVQAEWSLDDQEITLEIDLDTCRGEWHALDMAHGTEVAKALNLEETGDWTWLVAQLQQLATVHNE